MSIELIIKSLEDELKIRDEFIVAVQSCLLNDIGHCSMVGCTEDFPCRSCSDKRRILDMIDNPKKVKLSSQAILEETAVMER